jgi:hypothetical protein
MVYLPPANSLSTLKVGSLARLGDAESESESEEVEVAQLPCRSCSCAAQEDWEPALPHWDLAGALDYIIHSCTFLARKKIEVFGLLKTLLKPFGSFENQVFIPPMLLLRTPKVFSSRGCVTRYANTRPKWYSQGRGKKLK